MPSSCYLIDASIYIFRHYFGLPENWFSREGLGGYPTHAVYGYLNFLLTLLEQESPDCIAVAFDESLGTCFRNDIYPEYKANRVLPDDALAFQLNACVEVTGLLGIAGYASKTHEADDIIGTLAKVGRELGRKIIVISRDKDLSQLIGDNDVIWDFGKGDPQDRLMVKEKLGVWPEQLADYLALVGDSIDNIPGVPGIGTKTAAALLTQFKNIESLLEAGELLAALPVRGAKQLPAKIEACREQILMSRKLTVISDNAPIGDFDNERSKSSNLNSSNFNNSPELIRSPIDMNKLANFCEAMGLPDQFLRRAGKLHVSHQASRSDGLDGLNVKGSSNTEGSFNSEDHAQ